MSISKTGYYYKSKKHTSDGEILSYLLNLTDKYTRWGFDKMMLKVKQEQRGWNHKRVYRVYREHGLNIRIKPRKRLAKGEAKMLLQPIARNICWSIDFMSDALACGTKFRTFNVIDDYNRECLLIEASYSFPAKRVTQLLDQVAITQGYPTMIRVDHGPEFESYHFKEWAKQHHILLHFIQPGKPAQNGFIERFNRTYREDVLDMNLFRNFNEVRKITQQWINCYNQDRPHESLAGLSPVQFRQYRKQITGNEKFSTVD